METRSQNTTSAIAEAKRAARKAFGEGTNEGLEEVLKAVSDTAKMLGVPLDGDLQALLNAHSISLSGGTISVHDGQGLPLSSLGLGSSRLLVAGLLDKAKIGSDIILVDEIEHGLEPHRVVRFLDAIGAKDKKAKTQSFVTSHSPIVLRELEASQLFRIRQEKNVHEVINADQDDGSQGTLRSFPEAFLAKSVILCEGASEVGFIRGLDQYFVSKGVPSIAACGASLVDCGGVSKIYNPAPTLQSLYYRVAAFRDDDVSPDQAAEEEFEWNEGSVFKWKSNQKIEAAIINAADADLVLDILDFVESNIGKDVANEHIKSVSSNKIDFQDIRDTASKKQITRQHIDWLIQASTTKRGAWFKTVSRMEGMAREVIAPSIERMSSEFCELVDEIFRWARDE